MPKRPQTNPNPNHTKTQYSVPPLESEEKNLGPWIKLTATGTDFPKPKPKHEFYRPKDSKVKKSKHTKKKGIMMVKSPR